MENISAIGFLLVIQCLITSELACKGVTLQGDCLKSDGKLFLTSKVVSKVVTPQIFGGLFFFFFHTRVQCTSLLHTQNI